MLPTEKKNEAAELCRKMLRRKSESGRENGMIDLLKEVFFDPAFNDFTIDKYGSIVGHIKGGKTGKKLLLDGHIDTVPADEAQWSRRPYGGETEGGRIFGRGASDMKGAVSAMICAAKAYAADHPGFAGDIYLSGVVQEECFEGVASREISKRIAPDYVIVGEATGLNLNIGQRGRAEIEVETLGKSAHSANPKAGINAVKRMMDLLREVDGLRPPHHDMLGDGILELTDILSDPYPGKSVVPSRCKVTFDRRLLAGETRTSVLAPVKECIRRLESLDPRFRASAGYAYGRETCYTGEGIEGERFFPAWVASPREEYVQKALTGLRNRGIGSELSHYSFCTNGSHYAGEAGIKTMGFGPSRENLAHTVDEYIEAGQLFQAVEGYYAIIKSLL